MDEKKKMWTHRVIWIVITLLIILIPVISNAVKPELDIVDDKAYIDTYYESLDETSVDIYITFNREVHSGYATIKFYDDSNKLLETKRESFYSSNKKISESYFILVNGKVASYEIVSYEFEPVYENNWIFALLFPAGIFLLMSFLISYKEYNFNDKKITVYAGWYHHTLRVDGQKYDEHNTLQTFTPIKLSTTIEDGTKIEATISLTNRISVKVNDKLI